MFQRTRFAAISAIVVAIMVANTAYARPSGSFRSGFSSGKSNVSRSVGTQRQPGFGSFGKRQTQPPAAARAPQRDSAMSRDLDRKAARDQALRTYDMRRSNGSPGAAGATAAGAATAAGGAVPPLPPLNPVVPGGQGSTNSGYNGNHRGSGGYAQQGAPAGGVTSAPAPVIVRDSNNGWLWGIGGFMLGHAAGSHAAPPPATAPAPAPAAPVPQAPASQPGDIGAMADAAGAGDIAAVGEARREPARVAQAPASETSTIAKLAVLLLIGGLVWLAWKAFRLMSGAQAVKKHANYSFERN